MRNFFYENISENINNVNSQTAQLADNNQLGMSPEDSTKISNLNAELYKIAAEKDQLYTKMTNIQKNIDEIKNKYKNNQAINTQNQNNDDSVMSNIMESNNITIRTLEQFINEDERAADIIEFNDEPVDNNTPNNEKGSDAKTPEQVKREVETSIKETKAKPKSDKSRLSVSEDGDIKHIKKNVEDGASLYVKFKDNGKDVIGKIYKSSENSDWETKVINGESDTFEEMAFVKDLGMYGVLDKMEGFYDDVKTVKKNIIDKYMLEKGVNESILSINM